MLPDYKVTKIIVDEQKDYYSVSLDNGKILEGLRAFSKITIKNYGTQYVPILSLEYYRDRPLRK